MVAIRTLTLIASSILIGALSACAERADPEIAEPAGVSVIPAPLELKRGVDRFQVSSDTPLIYSGIEARDVAEYFSKLLERTSSIVLSSPQQHSNQKGAIRFALNTDESAIEGAYTLKITTDGIYIDAGTQAGLFYGAVTLWQLLGAKVTGDGAIELPGLAIQDAPRFSWRGLMIDSARHFQTLQQLKEIVDVMALHKLNVLHWHLTDDQAWRLEIKRYPRLTSIGAWRVPAGAGPAADIDASTGKPRLYGGFYTQQDVRDLVAYAAARHITIVPEIEMPGHASAAIAAYPELGVVKQDGRVPADWGIYENLFNVEESTFEFLENVLAETTALFPGEYIHAGGDEAVKKQWESSPRVQQRMRDLGVKDAHELQSYFIQRMEKYLNRHGRRLIGWDEILEGGLAPNATVMSWQGIDGAVAAATAGHDAVLAPWPTLYFDNRPIDSATPPGRGRVISVEDVYRFDPAPAALNDAQRKHILGVQANVWTEHIRTYDRLQYMILPRLAALSEIAWSSPERIRWETFAARLPGQVARYEGLGLRHSGGASVAQTPAGTRRGSHQLSTCSDKLILALEDDAPVHGERAVFFVDLMQPCWIYKGAELRDSSVLNANVGQVPFNFQIGDALKEIRFRSPATEAGELEVRLDTCDGELIATLPLAGAVSNPAVTRLKPIALGRHHGAHDLCFTFTQHDVDPTWVIDSVELTDLTHSSH